MFVLYKTRLNLGLTNSRASNILRSMQDSISTILAWQCLQMLVEKKSSSLCFQMLGENVWESASEKCLDKCTAAEGLTFIGDGSWKLLHFSYHLLFWNKIHSRGTFRLQRCRPNTIYCQAGFAHRVIDVDQLRCASLAGTGLMPSLTPSHKQASLEARHAL